MIVGKITLGNKEKFLDKLREGMLFETANTVSHDDVISLCKNNGINIQYCDYGTKEYKLYGSRIYKVVSEDLDVNKETCIKELRSTPSKTLLVKKASLNGSKVITASAITYKDKPRTSACRLRVLNALFNEGSIKLISKTLKQGTYLCEFRLADFKEDKILF